MRTTLTEAELAARWSICPKTLQRWRAEQCGPKYLKLGRKVQYTLAAVENYEKPTRAEKNHRSREIFYLLQTGLIDDEHH